MKSEGIKVEIGVCQVSGVVVLADDWMRRASAQAVKAFVVGRYRRGC